MVPVLCQLPLDSWDPSFISAFYSTQYGLFYFESGIAWCIFFIMSVAPSDPGGLAFGLANLNVMTKDCYAADLR